MSRIEEALRRASKLPTLPDAVPSPDGNSFDDAIASGDGDVLPEVPLEAVPQPPLVSPSAPSELEPPSDSSVEVAPRTGASRAQAAIHEAALTGKVVVSDQVKSTTVEQYRRLAAALHHAQAANDIKVVMVASAVAGEGKTLTAVNLALTLSESYNRRVLLMDADFRRPTLHQIFKVPNVVGLNDSLKADEDRKLTIFEASAHLSLLPAGKPDPDPMSGLTSGRMHRIIEEAGAKFDWVIIDTPPIGLITDAHLLAAMVNVAVLVIHANRTPCALVQRAVENLGRDRIIGVVLNQVDERDALPGGKYGDYYSASYYSRQPVTGSEARP